MGCGKGGTRLRRGPERIIKVGFVPRRALALPQGPDVRTRTQLKGAAVSATATTRVPFRSLTLSLPSESHFCTVHEMADPRTLKLLGMVPLNFTRLVSPASRTTRQSPRNWIAGEPDTSRRNSAPAAG